MTSSRIQKNPVLQQVACLGYSSVVNRYCSQTSACPKEALQVGECTLVIVHYFGLTLFGSGMNMLTRHFLTISQLDKCTFHWPPSEQRQ